MKDKIETKADVGLSDVSLTNAGSLYRILKATGVVRTNRWNVQRRTTFAIAIGWVPLLLIVLLFNPGTLMSFLRDYRIHARMLIAVPALLLALSWMESTFRTIVEYIRNARLLADDSLASEDGLMVGLRRLRDSVLPELIILLLIVAHTWLSFSILADATPWFATATGAGLHLTAAGWYTVLISAAIFQFLFFLSLWKWLLWSIFAFKLSRLRLKLVATHSDQHGGLGVLGLMANCFAPISFAITAVIGATWRHEILNGSAHLINFKLPAIALVVILAALAFLPLAFFVPPLAALRRKGILEYSTLGQIQTTEFDDKWIAQRAGHESQVLTEVESGNVLNFSQLYDRIKTLVPIPVDRATLIPLALSIAIPALPTIFAEIPVGVALQDLLKALR